MQSRTVSAMGILCGILSVAVLAGGAVLINNYTKMQQMESVLASVLPIETSGEEHDFIIEEMPGLVYPTEPSTSVQEESGAAYEENAIEVSESSTEESAESRDEEITQQETTQPLVGMEKESGEGDAYEEEWLPIDYGAAAANGYRVYEIGDGETLYGICLDVYGGLSHLDEICRLNRLENVDKILAGQKLILP